MTIDRFEQLDCWKESRILVREIFKITRTETFNQFLDLSKQLQRASLSVMNNIAEGFDRFSQKERMLFLNYAVGSCGEVWSMLYVCNDLKMINHDEYTQLKERVQSTQRLTLGLLRYLRNR